MNLKVLTTNSEVYTLLAYLSDKDLVALDTETTGLSKRDTIIGYSVCADEHTAYYVVLAAWNAETKTLDKYETNSTAKEVFETLKTKNLVGHNFVFDAIMIESNFKINLIQSLHTDTMVLAHLLNENRRIGLKELGKEMYGEDAADEAAAMKESVAKNGGTLTKDNYEMYKADPHLMGKYGAKDAWLTYKLFFDLASDLIDQKLEKFFYEDECMPLLRGPTYELNNTGLSVDTNRLTQLKKQLEAECLEAKAFIDQEIKAHVQEKYPGTTKKNGFNVGSNHQLSWLLFGKLELEFNTLTEAGKTACKNLNLKIPYTFKAKRDFIEIVQQAKERATVLQPEATVNGKTVKAKKVKDPWAYIAVDKKCLAKLAPKFKWIEKLLEYQRKKKILNTYVEGIEERTHYGIIQPSFLQTGTTSGRYSSRNPNFQNLPRDDKRIKECIIARPGKVFVGADQSQLEPRVFAYVSQDKALMAAFNGKDDFYSVIGMRVYGKYDCKPQKEGSPDAFGVKYKKLRDHSKVIALASTYGATAHQLAPTTGKSIEATAEDIATYFEEFPDVAQMMLDSHEMAKRDGQVTNIFGRPRRMPEAKLIPKYYGDQPHGDLPYEARNLLNLAVNHRIQSTGASIVNRGAIRFYENAKTAGFDCKIVCQVHDSLVVECNKEDANDIAMLLQDALENTVQLEGIKFEAIPKIGHNLAEV